MKRSPSSRRANTKRSDGLPESWFRTVLYSIGDAVITTDRRGRIRQMNVVAERLTGWKESDAIGQPVSRVFRIISEQTRKKAASPVRRVLREGIVVGLANHTVLLARDGREIPIADSGAPILDENNNVAGVVLVFRDQSSERAAQRIAQQARELAESIVQTVREPLLVLDEQLTVVAANRSFYQTFRVAPEETVGVKLYSLGNGQWNIPRLRSLLEDILPSNSHFDDFEVEHDFEHIGKRTMVLNARRLRREANHTGLILLAIEDVTERRRAEEARHESEERFAHISRLITDYAYAFRVLPDGSLNGEWLTESFTRVFGYTIDEINARGGWQSLVHPDDFQIAVEHARKVLSGEPHVAEFRFQTSYGTSRWLRDVAVPVWDKQHTRVIRIYGAAEDITDRKEAEQLLREREERLRTILETEPECVKVLDSEGRLLQMNPAGLQMIEADSFDQVAGRNVLNLVAPEHRTRFAELTRQVAQGKSGTLEFEIIGLKGTRRWLETHAVPLRDEQGAIIAVLGITRDVSERKRTQDLLRQSEEQFRALAESSLAGIYLFQDNVFQYVNPAFERIFGYDRGEIVARKLGPMELTHPDDRERVRDNIRKRETGEVEGIRYDFRALKKDGTVICVEVHGSRLDYRGKPAIIGTLVDITERQRAEERIRHLNRVYAVLSEINQAIVRLKDPQQLFLEACRIAVEKGELKFAWIGTYDASSNSIIPVAHAGVHDGYLELVHVRLDDPGAAQGPTITAFRQAHAVVCNDIATDPRAEPWRQEALRRGFAACVAFPLVAHGAPIGTFNLYAGEAGYFTDEELQLLDELAMDISFAIEAYRHDIERRQAEQALRERESQYRTLFEAAPIGIGVADLDGNLLIYNQAMLEQGGYTPEDIAAIGNVASLYYEPGARTEIVALLQRQGYVYQYPVKFKRKDGTPYDTLLTLTPINFQGKPCVQALVEDITARKRAEEALAASEAELRALFAAMHDVVLVIDRNGVYRRIAPTRPELLYRPAEELLGRSLQDVFPPEQAEFFLAAIHQALSTKQSKLIEYQLPIRGRTLWFATTVSPMSEDETLWVARDITEWKHAREQMDILADALRSIDECVSITDMNDNLIFVNEAFQRVYGYTSQELVGKHIGIVRSPLTDDSVYREIHPSTLRGGWRGELFNRKKDGTDFPIFLSTSVVRDDRGIPVALIGVASDITERKKAEQALRESEEKFRSVAETAATAIFIYQGEFLKYVNRYATILTGYSEEELLQKRFWEVVHPEHREIIRQRGLARQRGEHVPSRYEFKIITRSGEERWLDFTAGIIQLEGRPAALGTAFDITDRKRAEEALRQSEERYRKFFEQDLTADFIVTPAGKLLMCNPAYVQMFGFASEEEAMGTNITQLWPSPERRADFLKTLSRERILRYYPLELRRRDGRPVYAIANIIGVFDSEGRLQQIQSYLFDDTPRKMLEDQLRQAQKMESLGTLAGGIAHDFNNILGIVLGYASMLEQSAGDAQKTLHTVEAITKATQRGASLVKQLLTFARKTETVFESVLINDVIGEVTKLVQGTFPKTIEIETFLQPNIPPIVADATQMHQVLLNLCVNARDAMPKGGKVIIKSSTVPLAAVARTFPKANAREYVLMEVTDTGVGMDEATRRRIFDPFFTTKGPGKGTGLGLALVYGIIETHNGFIDVKSAPGKGSTFRIFLPIDDRFLIPVGEAHEILADIPGGTETIFVVEDEEMLRDLLQTVLSSKGYRVLTARDGHEGIALYAQRQRDIDLVICDLGMPKMGGDEVVRHIRTTNPSARVVIASGFIDPSLRSELASLGNIHFLQKPYRPDTLLRAVREILSASQ